MRKKIRITVEKQDVLYGIPKDMTRDCIALAILRNLKPEIRVNVSPNHRIVTFWEKIENTERPNENLIHGSVVDSFLPEMACKLGKLFDEYGTGIAYQCALMEKERISIPFEFEMEIEEKFLKNF